MLINYNSIVTDITETYGTHNPFRLAKEMGAIVLEVPLIGVNGFYHKYLGQDLIYLNQELTEGEKMIVCAHELGHMILHGDKDSIYMDSQVTTNGRIELEANAFALQLLQGDLNLCSDIPLIDWYANNQALKRRVVFRPSDQQKL